MVSFFLNILITLTKIVLPYQFVEFSNNLCTVYLKKCTLATYSYLDGDHLIILKGNIIVQYISE